MRSSFFLLGVFLSAGFLGGVGQAGPLGIDPAAMDPTVSPCQDFYRYACGTWEKGFQLPPGYARILRGDYEISLKNDRLLQDTLAGFAQGEDRPDVPFWKQLGDFYATCLDEPGAERATREKLPEFLRQIDGIRDRAGLARVFATLYEEGVDALFTVASGQDSVDATRMIAVFAPAGMGLPAREYYLEPTHAELRGKYLAHMARILILSGVPRNEAEAQAKEILALETGLANAQLPPEDERDPKQVYHPMDLARVAEIAPGFDWDAFFRTEGIAPGLVNVSEPRFLTAAARLFRDTPIEGLKVYFKWRFLSQVASTLSPAFFDEHFAFYNRTLNGQAAPFPRPKRCQQAVTAQIPFALGKAFTELTFSQKSKRAASFLIAKIKQAFRANVETVSWMDDATRAATREKLAAVVDKIGYPDVDIDYSSMSVGRSSYLENSLSASRFATRRDLAKIGKPVDRGEWGMAPEVINAEYSPNLNDITFPAAILQPPYFIPGASLVFNLGSMGAVMGHELTHGFDDQGSQYDAHGNLRAWWTPAVAEAFRKKTECLVAQYSGYTVGNGVHLNGKLTLGENIADLGGLKLAYLAQQKARAGEPAVPPVAGLDEEQQFFVAYAQSWCSKSTVESQVNLAKIDPHSPEKYRVNGVVANLPAFQQAFACPAGSPMAPKDRCEIW